MTGVEREACTPIAFVGEWPEAEAELLVRDVGLLRLSEVADLQTFDGFALIDVDPAGRLEGALALLQLRREAASARAPGQAPSLKVAFLASENTAMRSEISRAFQLGLHALFVRPVALSAFLLKLDQLGVQVPAAPQATLRPEPPSPRRYGLPPLGIREPGSQPVSSRRSEPPRSLRGSSRAGLRSSAPARADGFSERTPSSAPSVRLPSAPLSPELSELLSDAEARAQWHDEEFALPAPEDEVEAVLPSAVLDALDDGALDPWEEEPPSSADFTGQHTHNGSTTGVSDTEQGTHREPLQTSSEALTPAPVRPPVYRSGPTLPPLEDSDEEEEDDDPEEFQTPRPPVAIARSLAPAPAPRSSQAPSSRGVSRRPSQPPPTPRFVAESAAPPAEIVLHTAGDALAALARATASGFDGLIEVRGEEGVRIVRFARGDVALVVSHVAGEGLADFLAVRGEMSREKAARLARRMPTFGRFAAAALVASGVLAKDDMWTVLRAHSEFVLDQLARLEDGVLVETVELGRLADEPTVFGGSTGAEVIVDTVRRTVSDREARARIAMNSRLQLGSHAALLPECGLEPELRQSLEAGQGQRLDRLASHTADFAAVVYALSLLGVVELVPAIEPVSVVPAPVPSAEAGDWLDDQAIRAAIVARAALVDEGDYFALLGISPSATGYEVRRAFLELRRKFEPARALTPRTLDLKDDLMRILEVLEEAYEILGDDQRRARYLHALGRFSLAP